MVTSATNKLMDAMLAPSQISQAISTSVAAKTLDAARLEGAQMVQLIANAGPNAQQSPAPGDPLVAKATGLGSLLDVTA